MDNQARFNMHFGLFNLRRLAVFHVGSPKQMAEFIYKDRPEAVIDVGSRPSELQRHPYCHSLRQFAKVLEAPINFIKF